MQKIRDDVYEQKRKRKVGWMGKVTKATRQNRDTQRGWQNRWEWERDEKEDSMSAREGGETGQRKKKNFSIEFHYTYLFRLINKFKANALHFNGKVLFYLTTIPCHSSYCAAYMFFGWFGTKWIYYIEWCMCCSCDGYNAFPEWGG